MAYLSPDEAFERFSRLATNSSHFVWLLSGLRFYETQNHWVFGFLQIGSVTLLALEPLHPLDTSESSKSKHWDEDWDSAWSEFAEVVQPKITAFVAVYSPFAAHLSRQGFKTIRIGHEPWMDLKNCIPRGNSGKGVRSARNQALRQGLHVHEIPSQDLVGDSTARASMQKIHEEWKDLRLVELSGFMNACDPFRHPECRRYFVVRNREGVIEGYLVATPIPGIKSYFLEDMILSRNASKGAGELLTLEAMMALQESGVEKASLGVVSVLGVQSGDLARSKDLPRAVRWTLIGVPHLVRRLYNLEGLQTFRKRFLPEKWRDIHLCVNSGVKNSSSAQRSETLAWFLVLLAILRAFQPRVRLSLQALGHTLFKPFRRYPITWSVSLVSCALFGWLNHFGELPQGVLHHFGFSPQAPFSEWIYRSIASDFMYFDPGHFLSCALPLTVLLAWAERTHSRRYLISFIAAISILDDFFTFAVNMKPFHYFQPHVFQHLIAIRDVGGSLWLASLLGLQLCKLRQNREILFAVICLISVFGFAYGATHLHALILNLNHFLFLTVGYIAGRIDIELERRKSRAVAKGKPPQAKCVLPARAKETVVTS
jgi:hypothetical protein